MLGGTNGQVSWGFAEQERPAGASDRSGEVSGDGIAVQLLREINDGIKELVRRLDAPKPSARRERKDKTPIPYWQEMVKHVGETWKRKKGSSYPFTPRDFAQLKTITKVYMPWGVMALWDYFLASDDPFYRQTGYKIGAFVQSLPKLLDMAWKPKAETYRDKLEPPMASVTSLVSGLANGKKL